MRRVSVVVACCAVFLSIVGTCVAIYAATHTEAYEALLLADMYEDDAEYWLCDVDSAHSCLGPSQNGGGSNDYGHTLAGIAENNGGFALWSQQDYDDYNAAIASARSVFWNDACYTRNTAWDKYNAGQDHLEMGWDDYNDNPPNDNQAYYHGMEAQEDFHDDTPNACDAAFQAYVEMCEADSYFDTAREIGNSYGWGVDDQWTPGS
jgi:hypothetical protein